MKQANNPTLIEALRQWLEICLLQVEEKKRQEVSGSMEAKEANTLNKVVEVEALET